MAGNIMDPILPQRRAHPCERLQPSDGPGWDRMFDVGSAVIGAIVLVLIAATFRDYGITWDETWHLTYGRHVIHWYTSGFEDEAALTYRADYLYGGGFDGLGYLARQISPFGRYETIHLFGALVGTFGLLGAWKLGRLLGGPAGGFVSLLLLVLTPVWYGHMFNNPKDLPFAVGYVWALYYEIRILIALPAVPRGEWVKASIALGVAMSVRIAGLLTLCYLFLLVGLWVLWRAREVRDPRVILRYLRRLAPKLLGVTIGAWLIMLVLWPWAWAPLLELPDDPSLDNLLAPLRRPVIALARMSAFNLHERGMPFGAGRRISTLRPPPDYLLRYFVFKLPELVLILVTVALGVWVVRVRRLRRGAAGRGATEPVRARGRVRRSLRRVWRAALSGSPPIDAEEQRRLAIGGLLLFALTFPPLYTIIKRSPLYDGLRHFLFLVPILVVIAGVTLVRIARLVKARSRPAAWGVHALVAAYCVRMALAMIHLHPHEYLFFNSFIGRLPGAYLRYSTDYYGNTYKEGFETLREYLWEHERERYLLGPFVVDACMPDFVAREYLGTNFILHRSGGPPAEFYLGYTRNNCYLKHSDKPELTRVEREDTLLVLIRDLRDPEMRDQVSTRRPKSATTKGKSTRRKPTKRPSGRPKLDPKSRAKARSKARSKAKLEDPPASSEGSADE